MEKYFVSLDSFFVIFQMLGIQSNIGAYAIQHYKSIIKLKNT